MSQGARDQGDRESRLLDPRVSMGIGWAALVALVLLGLFGL